MGIGSTVHVTTAIGRARTELAAFDRALVAAGLGDVNVVRLSSAIPPGATIVHCWTSPGGCERTWGDRLYGVYAKHVATRAGAQAWAGIGWVQDPCTGAGLVVEHGGPRERDVRDQIATSLEDLQQARGRMLGPIRMRVIGATCTGNPTCALVIGAYGSEPWPCDTPLAHRRAA